MLSGEPPLTGHSFSEAHEQYLSKPLFWLHSESKQRVGLLFRTSVAFFSGNVDSVFGDVFIYKAHCPYSHVAADSQVVAYYAAVR